MSDDEDHVLLTLPRGERGEVRLCRSRYQGKTFTKAHLWFPGTDGQLHPGRQVLTFRDGELQDVIDALQKVAAKIGEQHQARPRPSSKANDQPEFDMAKEDAEGLF